MGQSLDKPRGPTKWNKLKSLVPLESCEACESKKLRSSAKAQVMSFLGAYEDGCLRLRTLGLSEMEKVQARCSPSKRA